MGLGGSLVVETAVMAVVSTSSLLVYALVPTGGLSGPAGRLGVILDDGSLQPDVQLP